MQDYVIRSNFSTAANEAICSLSYMYIKSAEFYMPLVVIIISWKVTAAIHCETASQHFHYTQLLTDMETASIDNNFFYRSL